MILKMIFPSLKADHPQKIPKPLKISQTTKIIKANKVPSKARILFPCQNMTLVNHSFNNLTVRYLMKIYTKKVFKSMKNICKTLRQTNIYKM